MISADLEKNVRQVVANEKASFAVAVVVLKAACPPETHALLDSLVENHHSTCDLLVDMATTPFG